MFTPENGAKYLWQWDTGQRLVCSDLPAGQQVHFAYKNNERAIVVDTYEENGNIYADIPNELLQAYGELLVYAYLISDKSEYTQRCEMIHINKRPMPEDYTHTQEKSVTITQNGETTVIPDGGRTLSRVNITTQVLPDMYGNTSNPSGITFYDCDGTVVTSWTLEELASKTSLPEYPMRKGLICQGWNWTLEDLKSRNQALDVGAVYITDDGKTRIYIRLQEGRTSPMLCCCPKGTVAVDWGDGTQPDILTGTSASSRKWTPKHNYAKAGDYVIRLTVDGEVGFSGAYQSGGYSGLLGNSNLPNSIDPVYLSGIQRIELGDNVTSLESYAFYNCNQLLSITIPNGITSIPSYMFNGPSLLRCITIPNSVETIYSRAFYGCNMLSNIMIPNSVYSIGVNAFNYCKALKSIAWPDNEHDVESNTFESCSLLSSITFPSGLSGIYSNAFASCIGMAFYDFTSHSKIPKLNNKNAFQGIPTDCQIRVPVALVDEWKAATNWAEYADHIVGV